MKETSNDERSISQGSLLAVNKLPLFPVFVPYKKSYMVRTINYQNRTDMPVGKYSHRTSQEGS